MLESKYLYFPATGYKELFQLRKYLKGIDGFIAGGCFKNLFLQQKVRDIDVFFETAEAFKAAVKKYSKKRKFTQVYENDNCVAFYSKELKITVELVRSLFLPKEEMLNRFDFSIVKAAYFLGNGENTPPTFMYHPKFFEHLLTKKLVIDGHIEKPVATFNRALKYAKYGYGLCLESKQVLVKDIIKRGDVTQLTNDLYFGFD